jgi:hypothetical protein
MSVIKTLFLAVIICTLATACNRAERRAYRSQAEVNKSQTELNERKMDIAEKYEKCVDKSSDEAARAKCEAQLKAAENL